MTTAKSFTSYFKGSEGTIVRDITLPLQKGSLPIKLNLSSSQHIDLKYMPTYTELGFKSSQTPPRDPRQSLEFKGGENEGLKRLHTYIWE